MSAQEIFDTVATHLATQGHPAHRRPGEKACAYRGVAGSKCAVGCLILDEEYAERMDNDALTVSMLISEGLFPARLAPFSTLLMGLQDAHDYADDGRDLVRLLRKVANDHDVPSVAILDTLTFPEKWA